MREDIRDLTEIHFLSLVEHLMLLLPLRVGSILSINSLREDLQVAYNTVRSWLTAFEKLFISFTLKPFTLKLTRSVHKERKLYLWDWSQIKDDGSRFENFVASHLWKTIHIWRDLGMGFFDLYFLRDRSRREVDFCITKDQKPWLLIETKLAETAVSESLDYFSKRFKTPAIQLLRKKEIDKKIGNIHLVSADRWLLKLS
jgi:predicted AAA+ superfamily ATPase